MKRWGVVVGVALAVGGGCTVPNPRSCIDGLCTDQAFPFCDVDGTLGGEPKECIAVDCEPMTFASCRGDLAVTCSATGNDYDLTMCERGCDAASGGCRLCDPNETACINGTVATCDATGAVTSSNKCPLGCFEDQPRCRDIDPSNNLATYLDMVIDPPALDLSNATFNVSTGEVREGVSVVAVPTFLVFASGNGVPIRVFVARSIKLNSASVIVDGDPRALPQAGIALLARGAITLEGELLIDPRAGGAVAGCQPGLGTVQDAGMGSTISSGGGGGGNATDGAAGGDVVNVAAGGVKDISSGTVGVVPLRGGCSGGYPDRSGATFYPNAGGAVQLGSTTRIDLDGTIDVRGQPGILDQFGGTSGFQIGGGGAGGGVLVEAPQVMLGPNARLRATGGNGAQACTTPSTFCGVAGVGATPTTPATVGGSSAYGPGPNISMSPGGGGGGLGRIRINTPDGTYTKANTAVEDGVLTTGTLATR